MSKKRNLLTRDPNGKFIWQADALARWLPTLLTASAGNELERLIEGGVRFCETEAAKNLEMSAENLRSTEPDLTMYGVRLAIRWKRRREVLLRAIQELRKVDQEGLPHV